jgi:hypothetical protein
MHEQEHHEMQMERSHPSGAEEWYCPTCGRRFLMQWPPAYSKIILQPGDEYAIHSGGKGGVRMGAPEIDAGAAPTRADGATMEFLGEPASETPERDQDATIELSEELLKPWRSYMENADNGGHDDNEQDD